MDTRPVVYTQQVCLQYHPQEVASLRKAANLLPPYDIREFSRFLRIDCYSVTDRQWWCAFMISRANNSTAPWELDVIEHLADFSLDDTLFALGQLEKFGLHRLKHGKVTFRAN